MGFLSWLFGGKKEAVAEGKKEVVAEKKVSSGMQVVLNLEADAKAVEIETEKVLVSFLCVPNKVLGATVSEAALTDQARNIIRLHEPALWCKIAAQVNTVVVGVDAEISTSAATGGLIDAVLNAVTTKSGISPQASLYLRMPEIDLADGQKETVLLGIAFADPSPKAVISGSKCCIPVGV
ncbi:MAG: hypothetical protein P8X63_04425 [Desulfuromonadaceae bacterium]